jgi:hypothetical protein
MIGDAYRAAQTFGDGILLPDWYFLTVPALAALAGEPDPLEQQDTSGTYWDSLAS